jgi:Mn2+/Fe2+ NRAMP family transporter
MVVSIGVGLSLDQFGIGPIQALLWTAVLYGLTAPVLIAVILHLCNQPGIMGDQVNGRWSNVLGLLTLLLMTGAAIALVIWWNA